MTQTVLHINTIISDSTIRNGQPIIAGTSIRVSDIVGSYIYRGLTPEDIATQYKLSLGQVHSALAYYYVNKSEMDTIMQTEANTAKTLLDKLDKNGKLIRLE